jgi:hypothetical protein
VLSWQKDKYILDAKLIYIDTPLFALKEATSKYTAARIVTNGRPNTLTHSLLQCTSSSRKYQLRS